MIYSKIEGFGKPLLIIHGFLGMSDNWKTLSLQYSQQGYEMHVLDMRNHGRSFHSNDFSYDIMAQDVFDYCIIKKLSQLNIIGHSMGGKVAMVLATQHQDLVDKLIIADIGPKFYPPHHNNILQGLNAINFNLKPSRAVINEQLQLYIDDFGTRQFLMKNLYWKTPDQLDFRFNLKVLTQKVSEIGAELAPTAVFKKPTLFIKGGNSNYVLDTDTADIKKHFPAATFTTVINAGHWLHAENPEMFFEKTMQFLQ